MFNHIPTDIPKMKRIVENGRRMYVNENGKRYPSVTNVLSVNNDWIKEWRERVGDEEANRISTTAARRGTAIHKLAETYLNNGKPSPDMFYIDMWRSLKPEIDKIDNIRILERYLYSDKYEIAGTPDVIAEYDGVLSAIDFKTSSKMKYKKNITNYFVQAAVCAAMYEEISNEKIKDIVVIIAVEDRMTPLVFKEKKTKYLKQFPDIREQYRDKYGI